jgi:hypothetical protein
MPYPLSPDRQFYWDGARWVTAVTPDGAWRFDGTAWRPAVSGPRASNNGAVAAVVAIGVIAALVVTGLGVFALTHLIVGAQRSVASQVAPACTTTGKPGHGLAEGDTVCGRTLGTLVVSADCTTLTSLPDALTAEAATGTSPDWKPADVGIDSSGCSMLAQPDQDVAIDSTDEMSANIVVIADFVPKDSTGSLGLRIACSQNGSCIDVSLSGDETYSLDEGIPNAGWKHLTDGSSGLGYVHYAQANRLILWYAGGVAAVYLNGYELTRATPDITQVSGYFGFYVDDGGGSKTEQVLLQRMYVFRSV